MLCASPLFADDAVIFMESMEARIGALEKLDEESKLFVLNLLD